MTTINYSVQNTSEGYTSWSGTFEWDATINTGTAVAKDNPPDSITVTIDSVTTTANVSRFLSFSGGGTYYVTWRTLDSTKQFPSPFTGYSLDIWSQNLWLYMNGLAGGQTGPSTWDQVIGLGQLDLSTTKYSLFYDYQTPRPIAFSKGGNILFSMD